MFSLLRVCIFLCLSIAVAHSFDVAENFVMSFVIENDDIADSAVVNDIVGATSFYDVGVYGQKARVAVIESGSIWQEHIFFENATLGEEYKPEEITSNFISAHKTACAGVIGGVGPEVDGTYYSVALGIAPLAEICSGITGDGEYIYGSAFYKTYKHFFQTSPVDVISTSESPIPEGEVSEPIYQSLIDAFAYKNTKTTFVAAAGNDGVENSVCHLALAYNGISVGAMGNPNSFDKIADFSSRAPSDFYNPLTNEIVRSVRASVDICAPGENIGVAYYDVESAETETIAVASGTSFSAPIVAGVASLLVSTSKELEADANALANGWSADARDSRVIKAVMLNSADKPKDWNNGQYTDDITFVSSDSDGNISIDTFKDVVITNQSLDYTYGAGMVNASKALLQYINLSQKRMWDLNSVELNSSVIYDLGLISQGEILTATLAWLVQNSLVELPDSSGESANDFSGTVEFQAFADLNLELWFSDGETLSTIALSNSEYNNVEHLHLNIAKDGNYYLRVVFNDVICGETSSETFAIAWDIVVPEPATFALFVALPVLVVVFIRRRSR